MIQTADYSTMYDKNHYKITDRNSIQLWFWILNPIFIIHELILGVVQPKVSLVDKKTDKALMERTIVPCPECSTLHDGRLWSKGRAYGNWFGYFCPVCEAIIPVQRNLFSMLFLGITYPLWFWWIENWKKLWVKKQPTRFENLNLDNWTHKKVPWWLIGLGFGVGMFVVMTPIMVFMGIKLTLELVVFSAILYLVAGILFGLGMKLIMGWKVIQKHKKNTPTPESEQG